MGKGWRKEEKNTQRGKEQKREGGKGRISLKTVWNT